MKKERTSILLPKQLMLKLRKKAKVKNLSLTAFIALTLQEGLRSLNESQTHISAYKFNPPVVKGDREPSIDISSRDSLFEVFDKDSS